MTVPSRWRDEWRGLAVLRCPHGAKRLSAGPASRGVDVMNILFIHQNFPGQYVHLAGCLADAGHRVVCITQRCNPVPPGVQRIEYAPTRASGDVHEYLGEVDVAVRNAVAVARVCERLGYDGFVPDLVIGHTGWGETLYVKDIWPNVPLLGYFEFFYKPAGTDVDFDAELPAPADIALRLRTRNAINLLGLEAVDWGQTPTRWQRDQYPARHRDRISIIHEGIDTEIFRPDPAARLWLSGGRSFGYGDEVITYSARNLEPYRGFHIFMRALPQVLRRRPEAHCIIVGGDGVSYGRPPPQAATWRGKLLAEMEGQLEFAPRSLRWQPAVPPIPDSASAFGSPRLYDLSLRTVLVVTRSSFDGLLRYWLTYPAGRGSHCGRSERVPC